MELWKSIRQRVLRDGVSIRQIQRETGLHHEKIRKILSHSSPPRLACPPRAKPKIGPYPERIAAILEVDRESGLPKKQRHTAKWIFERIRIAAGYNDESYGRLLSRARIVFNHGVRVVGGARGGQHGGTALVQDGGHEAGRTATPPPSGTS